MAAMLYEALPRRLPCLYSHHNLEFQVNLDYLSGLKNRGFDVEVVHPFLTYFELMERGMGFLTLREPWCVPMLVGTGIIEWLRQHGARSPRDALMFRGMSGSEYSRKFHSPLELYRHLDLPCFNPMLNFTTQEILAVIKDRYGLPLNPIYKHMGRTYCICCYTSDIRRQAYSRAHHPRICAKYYGQIESLLFGSRLIDRVELPPELKTRDEKLRHHGFVYWQRSRYQNTAGAVRSRLPGNLLCYRIRDGKWIAAKHLGPIDGRWAIVGNEVRIHDVDERVADIIIKRMINCVDCGFCTIDCLPCRRFNRKSKTLEVTGCIQCGKCIRTKHCMGWKHRFWRRVIVASDGNCGNARNEGGTNARTVE